MSGVGAFAIFEIGMNHAGEIETLVKMVRPQVAVDHHRWSRCIWNSLPASRRLPTPRRKFLNGLEPGGAVVLNRDNSQFARLQQRANKLGISRIVSFGADKQSDARLLDVSLHAASLGRACQYSRAMT